jgi:uncharacterized membrane protein
MMLPIQLVLLRLERKWALNESTYRSIAKTISWRITGSLATFLISFWITGNLTTSTTIAIIQLTANTILYYVHERVWNKISWGRNFGK